VKVTGLFHNAQETIRVRAGDVIFEEGDTGTEMYGVVSGRVELRGGGRVLRTLEVDDVFGEMAIVDSSPRSATAVAVVDTELAVVNRHRFLFLVHETPTFALQVMSAMGERIRERDRGCGPARGHPSPGGG
jgi:CRP/FNR family transcriptional regulator, cyclic AMP receptor protein